MTKQEKQLLLLVDLCARLSFGITLYRITDNSTHRIQYSDITENIDQFSHFLEYSGIENIKPYLRPLSSMTDEEREEFRKVGGVMSYSPQHDTWAISAFAPEAYDWLNAHQFDYRGLIEMGLALENV